MNLPSQKACKYQYSILKVLKSKPVLPNQRDGQEAVDSHFSKSTAKYLLLEANFRARSTKELYCTVVFCKIELRETS